MLNDSDPRPDDYHLTDMIPGRGMGSLMGGDAFSQGVIEDLLLGTGMQYSPGGIQAPPMFPEDNPDPQSFIQQQLAGDVIPMYGGNPQGQYNMQQRFNEPSTYQGSRGALSILQGGGRTSPYLDLLNVLSYPGGGNLSLPNRR